MQSLLILLQGTTLIYFAYAIFNSSRMEFTSFHFWGTIEPSIFILWKSCFDENCHCLKFATSPLHPVFFPRHIPNKPFHPIFPWICKSSLLCWQKRLSLVSISFAGISRWMSYLEAWVYKNEDPCDLVPIRIKKESKFKLFLSAPVAGTNVL